MYDTSIPKIELAMRLERLQPLPQRPWPAGYSVRTYRPGDIDAWARMEQSAGEFADVESGKARFRTFYPTDEGLGERMLFAIDSEERPVATATAWYAADGVEGQLHWVCVDAAHQGRGLARPMIRVTLERLYTLGHHSVWLHTQTSSWVAIRLYHEFGFRPARLTGMDEQGWKIVSEKTGIPMCV